MLTSQRAPARSEDGFTLIELMVVVLIIAILIAIAIPTFLGAQNRARDRAAQSDLRNALTAAKTLATDAEGHFLVGTALITATDLKNTEGSLTFISTLPAASGDGVGVSVAALGVNIAMVRESASGTDFGLIADDKGNVLYCKGSDFTGFPAANADP